MKKVEIESNKEGSENNYSDSDSDEKEEKEQTYEKPI